MCISRRRETRKSPAMVEEIMMIKGYITVWMLGVVAVLATYLTGNMTPLIAVFFGFLSFGAVFMGMMGVLPTTVGHHDEPTIR